MNHLETGFSRTDSEQECWDFVLARSSALLHYSKNIPNSQTRFSFQTVLDDIDPKEIF